MILEKLMKKRKTNAIMVALFIIFATSIISCSSTGGISEEESISKDQGQFWTSNRYMVTEEGSAANQADTAFGVNHATGHIKGYPDSETNPMAKHVRAVSGSVYGTVYNFTLTGETTEKDNTAFTCVSTPTYIDNGDGTVSDTSTGLMWMQTDSEETLNWEEALSYCENLEAGGYSDWRLPDVKELQSIVDYDGSYPAIDQDFFACTEFDDNENYYFWTGTSAYFNPAEPTYDSAWYVAFGYAVGNDGEDSHGAGAVRFSPKYDGSEAAFEGGDNISNSVRAVRIDENYYSDAPSKVITTGQENCYDGDGNLLSTAENEAFYGQDGDYESVEFSFTNNGDGTVTDNNTGLIWQTVPSDDHLSIDDSEQYCEDLELAGITDWRIPTAEELFSISDFSTGWPYIDENYFEFPAASDFQPPAGGGPQG